MRKYSVIDIFAGAGGLSLGLEQTGRFEVKAAFEKNEAAQKTFKFNHQGVTIYPDVLDVDFKELLNRHGSFDIVVGGPPCQGFSNANRQHNQLINMNNRLVRTYVKFVKELSPEAFLLENVKMLGSETHRFFSTLADTDIVLTYPSYKAEDVLIYHGLLDIPFDELLSNSSVQWPIIQISIQESIALRMLKRKHEVNKKFREALKMLVDLVDAFCERVSDQSLVKNAILSMKNSINISSPDIESVKQFVEIVDALVKLEDLAKNSIKISGVKREGNKLYFCTHSYTVIDFLRNELGESYLIDNAILNSFSYGVPQNRERFIMLGVKKSHNLAPSFPREIEERSNVYDAIGDLYDLEPSFFAEDVPLYLRPGCDYLRLSSLRDNEYIYNHVITKSTPKALERFASIAQGKNFHSLSPELIQNYAKPSRTQNSIYLRLDEKKPSPTVTNVRKAMWIHPVKDRAISVREAARLQSFPDSFIFIGTKDQQYQQVGNAVPPLLAKAVATSLCECLDKAFTI